MRTDVIQNLEVSLEIIGKWALSEDENIRRFASELTRPRGVWCAHIEQLKTQPQKAFFILDYLKNDSSKYVQNSVANWLNDASKSQPDWVKKVCKQWLKESNTKATQYIVKRGTRNLEN
jgi:3-methyladenine DNA glycosylase AlkC